MTRFNFQHPQRTKKAHNHSNSLPSAGRCGQQRHTMLSYQALTNIRKIHKLKGKEENVMEQPLFKTKPTKIEQQTATTRLPDQRHPTYSTPARWEPQLRHPFRSHVYGLPVPPPTGGALPLWLALLHHGGRGAAAEADPVPGGARTALLLLSRQARSRPA